MDFMVFSGQWPLTGSTTQNAANSLDLQSAFWVINFLVLGFLFGERAMRNVMPFFQNRIQSGGAQRPDSTQNSAVG
jgi:hypothetical protein